MKSASGILLSLTLITVSVAQDGGQSGYTVASRSAHETVWQRVEWQTNQLGETVARTNAFVELATGLNFFDEATQVWQPSREEWQVYPDAIVATAGRHKVILATNLNLGGSVDMLTPDGVRLISNPVGLGFYDPVDGKHQMLAEIKNCAPQWGAATNEIVFRDCFEGIRASIRYLYTHAGVHQHVVLEQRLELPAGFSDKTRLECYTEFAANTPMPRMTSRVLRRENDPVLRAQMVEPDFTDSELEFGELAMRAGTAFTLESATEARPIRVGKRFEMIARRPVLTESVEFKQLEPLLAGLVSVERPKTGLFALNSSRQIKPAKEAVRLPREHFRTVDRENEIQLASSPLNQPAVVIDYELLSSTNNYTLRGDTTYYVSGYVSLSGTTTIEGGAVIKYTNRTSAYILLGNLDCKTDPYRPAIFTSMDDNTVGDTLPGSTGSPTNYPGGSYITTSTTNTYRHLRMSYAGQGILVGGADLNIWHCQFFRCNEAVFVNDYGRVNLHNVLFSRCATAVSYGDGVKGEHVTADQTTTFLLGASGVLTNSILTAVTNVGVTLYNCVTNSSGNGIYQTVGAGNYYLAASSTNRDVGSTVTLALLLELKKKTTYPPVEITTNITANTTFSPQAPRDTGTLDLGFHYDPIDFVVSGRTLTNSTLTLTNGVVLGNYGASSIAGIYIRKGGNLVSEGSPINLNRIVRYNTVQEQATTNWSATSVADCVNIVADSSPVPQASFRFTAWSLLGRGYYFRSYAPITTAFIFKDCEFGSGLFDSLSSIAITNCFLDRMHFLFYDDSQPVNYYAYNSLFRGGSLSLYRTGAGSWQFKDNLFDQTAISQSGTITHDHNGYVSGYSRLTPTNADDVVLTNNPVYQTSHLGRFYYPTNDGLLSRLINVGSRNATNAGLYYFTTTTNQTRENNTIVDIGFHYAADLDADGVPDYTDTDDDGDGMPDDWETQHGLNPESSDANDDPDGDWITNLQEYNGGTDSTNPRDVMVVTWGDNSVGQCAVPSELRGVIAVSGGFTHSLGLKTNGTVASWGELGTWANQVPTGLAGVQRIAAGWEHNVALLTNGSVTAWGLNQWPAGGYLTNVPAHLTNATAISVGALHSLASQANGIVIGWGVNDVGQTNVPSSLTNSIAIAAGASHSVAARADGTVIGWGLNNSGQCTPPGGLSNVVALAAGWDHSVALRNNGTVVAWGNNAQGQTNVPSGLTNVVAIAANYLYSLALKSNRTVVAWGGNAPVNVPAELTEVLAIGAGHGHAVAVRTGRLTAVIIQQPVSQASLPGSNITFSVLGLGLAGVKYQWQLNGVNISGATNATLTLTSVGTSHEGSYRVIISTGAGSVTSSTAVFALVRPPVITSLTQPTQQVAIFCNEKTLGVTATATGEFAFPISYQWQLEGANISGATSSNYTFVAKDATMGDYSVTLSNPAGSTNVSWEVTMTYAGSYVGVGTLAYHLATNAVGRTNGFTGSPTDKLELSGWTWAGHSGTNLALLTNAVWSTNFWLKGVQGLSATCIGFSNGVGGQGVMTMVSPRHYLCSKHMHPESYLAAFLDTNNVIHWRTTMERVDLPPAFTLGLPNDTAIGILNADLPSSVGFLPLVPTNLSNYLPTNNWSVVQGIGMNQDMRVFSQPMTFGHPLTINWNSSSVIPFGLGTNWSVALRGGDSSGPARLLVGNQLVLVGHNTDVESGPNYAFVIEGINQQMHYLSTNNNAGTDYQLTPFSLTNWPTIH